MSTPIIEHIGAFLESAISEITVANGFNYDLTATRRKRHLLEDEVFTDLTTYILQHEAEPKSPSLAKTGTRVIKQQFMIWAVVLQSDRAEDCIDTKMNQVRSDIEKKVCEDITCGGYAEMLDILGYAATDEPEVGVAVVIEVTYAVQWNDPYTQK